jgi:hypothetical protein
LLKEKENRRVANIIAARTIASDIKSANIFNAGKPNNMKLQAIGARADVNNGGTFILPQLL